MPRSPETAILRRRSLVMLLATVMIAACGASRTPSPSAGLSVAPDAALASPALSARPGPTIAAETAPGTVPGASPSGTRFPGGLMIADTSNSRVIVIDEAGNLRWQFPGPAGTLNGQPVDYDDAFISPDGTSIVANDEDHQVIDRIDIASRQVVWRYGHYGSAGSAPGYLHNPDDAYPLANGDVIVADIMNCRVIEIAPSKEIVRTDGLTGVCRHAPATSYAEPNGDTPLPDGGVLITEITGSHVVRLSSAGAVVFDIHVPAAYPSDAQIDRDGNIVLADYSNPGAVLCVSPSGALLWRYAPASGAGRLDHPSLATPLPDGTVSVNDDFRQRMVVIDPHTMSIVWQYGHTDVKGSAPGFLSKPDGHDPLPLGSFAG